MNDSKYNDNGTTQRNGTTATSSHTWLVVASNMSDAQAGKKTQSTRRNQPTRAAAASCSTGVSDPTAAGVALPVFQSAMALAPHKIA